MAIKNVFLDLDDTLFDFHEAERIAIGETLSHFGIEPTKKNVRRYSEINKECWLMLERGEKSREEILVLRFERLFSELSVNVFADDVRDYYEQRLSLGHIFVEGAQELLEELYGKYKLYITSNGTARVQNKRIALSGIAKYFDEIFVSENIGANKPSEAFFDGCFARMPDALREETIIVGDSLTSDIAGGIAAGIHTCWFDKGCVGDSSASGYEYRITSLGELIPLIESIV